MSATSATGPPAAGLSAGAQARLRIRRGFSGPTSGMAAGLVQANLICVPADWAFDVLLFAQRNPKPCPVKIGRASCRERVEGSRAAAAMTKQREAHGGLAQA